MPYIIEIATTDYASTLAAVEGGADRIELCSALSEGGLTPSHGLIAQCLEDFNITLFPIIRPRGGDFLYSQKEFDIIKADIELCKTLGCKGVVTGFLKEDGNIDVEKTRVITELASPMQVTFHRAFDRCLDPFQALEDIIAAGCTRILTSGQKPTAPQGAELIRQLVKAANGRIIIMPGSGVRTSNIKELAQKTGAVEFHSSLRSLVKSSMKFIHPDFAAFEEEYHINSVDAKAVAALVAELTT